MAPHLAEVAKQLIGIARMRGIAASIHRAAARRRAAPAPALDDQALDELFSALREPSPFSPSRASRGPEGGAAGNLLNLGVGGAQLDTAYQSAQLALRQARMPIREGGLGLTAAADVCGGAYIGGWAGTMRSVGAMPAHASFPPHLRADSLGSRLLDSDDEHCAELRGAWTEVESELRAAPEPVEIAELVGTGLETLQVSHRMAQKQLAHGLAAARALRMREEATDRDRVRLVSSAGFGASSWLRAVLVRRELQFTSLLFRTALCFWLHVPIPALASAPGQCDCKREAWGRNQGGWADVWGDHDLVCAKADKLTRHNYVCGALIRLADLVDMPARRATVMDMRADRADVSKRQPDVVWQDFHNHSSELLLDVVITHPTAASIMNTSNNGSVEAGVAGPAATAKENEKVHKYFDLVAGRGYDFSPFGLETYGAWGSRAQQVLRELLTHAAQTSQGDDVRSVYGWSAPHLAEAAKQLVGVARMKGIAVSLHRAASRRRAAPTPQLDEQALDELFSAVREPSSFSPSRGSRGPEGGATASSTGVRAGPRGGAHSSCPSCSSTAVPPPPPPSSSPSRAPRTSQPRTCRDCGASGTSSQCST